MLTFSINTGALHFLSADCSSSVGVEGNGGGGRLWTANLLHPKMLAERMQMRKRQSPFWGRDKHKITDHTALFCPKFSMVCVIDSFTAPNNNPDTESVSNKLNTRLLNMMLASVSECYLGKHESMSSSWLRRTVHFTVMVSCRLWLCLYKPCVTGQYLIISYSYRIDGACCIAWLRE